MPSKTLWYAVAAGFLVIMVLFFAFNRSYERSLEAKVYYTLGSYEKAYALAQESFELDAYNRMAATVMAQSKTALKYVAYIDEAERFMQRIGEIAQMESVGEAERAKIKIMCDIMIERYVKLAPSVVTDRALVDRAADYYRQFVELHAKVSEAA